MLGEELAQCWLKIGRAEEHAKSVTEEIVAWKKTKPYTITSHRKPNLGHHRLVIHFDSTLARDRWALICGDCIHNLRSALDYLIYAIAVHESGLNPPPDDRRLQFPIADDAAGFSRQVWRIQSLSPAVRTIIESVQPYNRSHHFLTSLLGTIRDFDDSDKHRLLNIAVHGQQTGHLDLGIPFPSRLVGPIEWNTGELTDGAELASFTVQPPTTADVKCHYTITFAVGLRHAPGPSGGIITPIEKIISLLCEEVRTIVEMIGSEA